MAKQRKTPPRRGATSQRRAPAKKRRLHLPGWFWALGGVIAGFFFAQHLNGTAPWQEDAPPSDDIASEQRDGKGAEGESQAEDDDGMPTFEFYTLLPESEVIAPGGAVPSRVTPPEPSASDDEGGDPIAQVIAAKSRSDEEPAADREAPTEPGHYMLQAASFREVADANELRSRLQNLSLLAKISEVKASGVTWHRVQVGPYEDTRELTRARDLMSTQGIEPLLIQLQD
ncbi:SPOR domain-containing protein [Halomonas garicola]|uniref:SPOR domain-containing protein n=1 Tax=Halomonas garicola TaxID=1690008 RepID=UPI00289F20BE|nr:SPOR domain-containing protein [Halomonas garicola]